MGTDDECEPIDDVDDEDYNEYACHSNTNNDIDFEPDELNNLPVKSITTFYDVLFESCTKSPVFRYLFFLLLNIVILKILVCSFIYFE